MSLRAILLALVMVFGCGAVGCGTIFNGGSADVYVRANVDGAQIFADGRPVGTTIAGQTVSVKIARRTQSLECRKTGYEPAYIQVSAGLDAWMLVLDIVFGVVWVIVDAITGGWNGTSPNHWTVNMVPLPPAGPLGADAPFSPIPSPHE